MYALLQHREPSGTAAGTLANGTHNIARTINTITHDDFGITLTTGEDGFTFAEDVVIRVRATAPINVAGYSQLVVRVCDATTNAVLSEYVGHSGRQRGVAPGSVPPVMNQRDTVTTETFAVRAGEVVRVAHLANGSFLNVTALGEAAGRGVDEVYTEVEVFAA